MAALQARQNQRRWKSSGLNGGRFSKRPAPGNPLQKRPDLKGGSHLQQTAPESETAAISRWKQCIFREFGPSKATSSYAVYSDAGQEYMPSGPPMNPLIRSHFSRTVLLFKPAQELFGIHRVMENRFLEPPEPDHLFLAEVLSFQPAYFRIRLAGCPDHLTVFLRVVLY